MRTFLRIAVGVVVVPPLLVLAILGITARGLRDGIMLGWGMPEILKREKEKRDAIINLADMLKDMSP